MRPSLKILHLIDSGGFYGAEAVVLTLMEASAAEGHQVVLGTFRDTAQGGSPIEREAGRRGLSCRRFPLGTVPWPRSVRRLARSIGELGVDIVGLADTVGYAGPRQVGGLCRSMSRLCPDRPYIVHLHDTRGMAIANASAALDAGARIFDASLGGLGGCPYAPGASGNLATEDLVYMLEGMGFETGVDIDRLITASEHVGELVSRTLPSKMLQAELGKRRKAAERAARSK